MARKALLLQLSRKVHLYFGIFISPALLFFAFTGAYQTLGLHEASSDYKPPAILASLGQIHKKQTYVLPARRPGTSPEGTPTRAAAGPNASAGEPTPDTRPHHRERSADTEAVTATPSVQPAPTGTTSSAAVPAAAPSPSPRAPLTLRAKQQQHLPLKLFFVLVSVGLFTSTLTGIYMAYKYDRNKLLLTGLLLLGAVLPLILVSF